METQAYFEDIQYYLLKELRKNSEFGGHHTELNEFNILPSEFNGNSRETYKNNFELMQEYLPLISKDMGDIRAVKIENDIAEFEVRRIEDGVEYSYYVEFIKDSYGV